MIFQGAINELCEFIEFEIVVFPPIVGEKMVVEHVLYHGSVFTEIGIQQGSCSQDDGVLVGKCIDEAVQLNARLNRFRVIFELVAFYRIRNEISHHEGRNSKGQVLMS